VPGLRAMEPIDVRALLRGDDATDVVRAIDRACREIGFFTITGHGIDPALIAAVERLAREFFALDDATKAAIAMEHGGKAWRGWFPLGGELTDGIPDGKEGLYFGAELPASDPRPLHGPNLFPAAPAELRVAVLTYLAAMRRLGGALVGALGWDLEVLTADPVTLFRIFRYPPARGEGWGVAEHTDYGLLTILHQDDAGGLQVRGTGDWVDVVPEPGTFVCDIGDMLEQMTQGAYRSTAHRVRNPSDRDRVSLAYFFDPDWDAEIPHVGRYADYLLNKVTKVFPALGHLV
jgi:isopenicillin N synthase-like dioxygenase